MILSDDVLPDDLLPADALPNDVFPDDLLYMVLPSAYLLHSTTHFSMNTGGQCG